MSRNHTTSRRGFILVMTLMLLAIAAVMLASTARSSTGLAVHAVQARQDLQRHWGGYSIRHAVLDLAPALLDAESDRIGEPATLVGMELTLGGHACTITLSDEQAKVNINALMQHQNRAVARQFVLGQLTGVLGGAQLHLPDVRDRPASGGAGERLDTDRPIVSINHLLPDFNPQHLDASDGAPFGALTCWGDGRINVTRATDESVSEITRPMLGTGQAQRLGKLLAEHNGMALDKALAAIGVRKKDIPELLQRLTADTYCYSVWIRTDNGRRSWYELSVLELDPGKTPDSAVMEPEAVADPGEPENQTIQSDTPDPERIESGNELPDETINEAQAGSYPRVWVYQW